MTRKITLLDVAKACEVSIATASRVLNNPESVKMATRQRVLAAMEEMGYTPEKTTEPKQKDVVRQQSPAESHTTDCRAILTILPDMINPFYTDVLKGIMSTADFHGYECIEYCIRKPSYSFEQIMQIVEHLRADGVILLGRIMGTTDLERLSAEIPVVQCAEYDANSTVPYVSIDDYAAAKMAVRLLLQGGHRRIALANGPLNFKYATERERGYCDALREAGLSVEARYITHQVPSDMEIAMAGMQRIITKEDHPDAVFAASDILAVAAVKTADRVGVRVPQDMAVLGFDGTYISNLITPSLSTVSQRGKQMGSYACDMLLDRINGRNISNPQLVMDVELLVREST